MGIVTVEYNTEKYNEVMEKYQGKIKIQKEIYKSNFISWKNNEKKYFTKDMSHMWNKARLI